MNRLDVEITNSVHSALNGRKAKVCVILKGVFGQPITGQHAIFRAYFNPEVSEDIVPIWQVRELLQDRLKESGRQVAFFATYHEEPRWDRDLLDGYLRVDLVYPVQGENVPTGELVEQEMLAVFGFVGVIS